MKSALTLLVSSATRGLANGGSAGSQTDLEPVAISDAEVAWLLIDAAGSCLSGDERTNVFIELGCGEHYPAIERTLTAVISSRTPLPMAVLSALTSWLRGYATSPAEVHLRKLLAEIRLQQFQLISGDVEASPDANPSHSQVDSPNTTGIARRRGHRRRQP